MGSDKLKKRKETKTASAENKYLSLTRPKPAYGRQGLDWIVRPGYSFVVFSYNRGVQLTSMIKKRDITHGGPQPTSMIKKCDVTHGGPNVTLRTGGSN